MDGVGGRADFIHPGADVVSGVALDVQVYNGQAGPVRGALDLIFFAGTVDDGLERGASGNKLETETTVGLLLW